MPGKRCIVQNCGATNKDKGVSLHKFPKNPSVRRLWTNFVRTHRKAWSPTDYSVVCSHHFLPSDFIDGDSVKAALGFGNRRKQLKPTAVPSLSYKHLSQPQDSLTARGAYKKREHQRTLRDASSDAGGDAGDSAACASTSTENNDAPASFSDMPDEECSTPEFTDVVDRPTSKSVKIQARAPSKNKGIQFKVPTRSIGVQCELLKHHHSSPCVSDIELDENSSTDGATDDEFEEIVHNAFSEDDDGSVSDDESTSTADPSFRPTNQERKFIVFETALLQLFSVCVACHMTDVSASVASVLGTLVLVDQVCNICGNKWRWKSQPKIGDVPAGNLLLSSAILFAGALPRKTLRVLTFMGVAVITPATYFRHQAKYLHSTILRVWKAHEEENFHDLQDVQLVLGGDGRNDSMGHCAKYGTYTLMDLDGNKIINVNTIQSNEVKGSYHMELEGLRRGLHQLAEAGLQIKALVTDRHPQIQKFLRENYPEISHYFDVWHVAKGLKKKLQSLAKRKGFELISRWERSILNHIYWCTSSSEGNGALATAKWMSICNHLQNKHHGHENQLYPACTHPPLVKKWFTSGTELFEKLSDLLESPYLKKDVYKLSPYGQTSSIEGFHSIVNHFCPKMYHFSYHTMLSKTMLAALHYNENSTRTQAVNMLGEAQFSIQFPKAKMGGYVVRALKANCTYDYVELLFDELYAVVGSDEQQNLKTPPPPLCSQLARPDKSEAVQQLYTRFESST